MNAKAPDVDATVLTLQRCSANASVSGLFGGGGAPGMPEYAAGEEPMAYCDAVGEVDA